MTLSGSGTDKSAPHATLLLNFNGVPEVFSEKGFPGAQHDKSPLPVRSNSTRRRHKRHSGYDGDRTALAAAAAPVAVHLLPKLECALLIGVSKAQRFHL